MKLPSFLRRRPGAVETKASGFFALTAEGRAHWSSRSYASLSREGFMKNPVAHRAVRMIAEAAASVPWLAYAGEAERPGDGRLALLARPNGRMAGTDFFETLYGHLLLSGNAFVEGVRVGEELRELHLLRPDRMRIVEGRDGWPEAYEYRAGNHVRRHAAGEGQAILHLRLFHPLDDQLGFAPLEAASVALDLSNAAAVWNKALLDNSARPSGALVYQPKEGGNLSPDQYDRLKSELEEGYSGPARAGRPMLLEGGLDWKAMGLSPREMDFVEARNGAARDIALAFGVPPMLIGIPGDATYANYQEANRAFWRLTVLPLVSRTAGSFAAWFSEEGDGLRLVPGSRPGERACGGEVRALGAGGGGGVFDGRGEAAGGGVLRGRGECPRRHAPDFRRENSGLVWKGDSSSRVPDSSREVLESAFEQSIARDSKDSRIAAAGPA